MRIQEHLGETWCIGIAPPRGSRAQPFPRSLAGLSINEAGDIVRFSVSPPANLLEELDRRVTSRGYALRSELMRDKIRERLVEYAWQGGAEVAGVRSIIFGIEQAVAFPVAVLTQPLETPNAVAHEVIAHGVVVNEQGLGDLLRRPTT